MEHERTAVIVSSLVIEREERFLFLEETREEGQRLNLPGGHVQNGESPEEAAVREGLEETGLVLTTQACVGALMNTWNNSHSVRFIFRMRIEGGEAEPEPGTKFLWMTLEEYRENRLERMNGLDEMLDLVQQEEDNKLKFIDYRK